MNFIIQTVTPRFNKFPLIFYHEYAPDIMTNFMSAYNLGNRWGTCEDKTVATLVKVR